MTGLFYVAGCIALAGAVLSVTSHHAVHALLSLLLCILGVASTFFALGAPYSAALEVIVYAGAIMMLFVVVLMVAGFGADIGVVAGSFWQRVRLWVLPVLLGTILKVQWVVVIVRGGAGAVGREATPPSAVGAALFGRYVLGVELTSFLLLAGLVAAFHLARKDCGETERGRA
jgi:NADH-quinone oxidoreductase subunit J